MASFQRGLWRDPREPDKVRAKAGGVKVRSLNPRPQNFFLSSIPIVAKAQSPSREPSKPHETINLPPKPSNPNV